MAIASPPTPNIVATTEWRPISKAIRDYLRYSYANRKLGIVSEVPPLRLCVYNGKGTGHYPTAGDGRADWSGEFYAYIDRAEARTPRDRSLRFYYEELVFAMERLHERSVKWHTVLTALDVYGVRLADYVIETGLPVGTVIHQRSQATLFLYQTLRLNLHFAADSVDYMVFREVP